MVERPSVQNGQGDKVLWRQSSTTCFLFMSDMGFFVPVVYFELCRWIDVKDGMKGEWKGMEWWY